MESSGSADRGVEFRCWKTHFILTVPLVGGGGNFHTKSALALRIPRYYRHPLLRTKSSPSPAEAIEVWLKMISAIADSR